MSIPLKVYNPVKSEDGTKPRPMLKLREDDAAVCAVTAEGIWIAVLWLPGKDGGIHRSSLAKECLKALDYDTSWAEWDLEGRFVRWAE